MCLVLLFPHLLQQHHTIIIVTICVCGVLLLLLLLFVCVVFFNFAKRDSVFLQEKRLKYFFVVQQLIVCSVKPFWSMYQSLSHNSEAYAASFFVSQRNIVIRILQQ